MPTQSADDDVHIQMPSEQPSESAQSPNVQYMLAGQTRGETTTQKAEPSTAQAALGQKSVNDIVLNQEGGRDANSAKANSLLRNNTNFDGGETGPRG